jgi:hypothetical protein
VARKDADQKSDDRRHRRLGVEDSRRCFFERSSEVGRVFGRGSNGDPPYDFGGGPTHDGGAAHDVGPQR